MRRGKPHPSVTEFRFCKEFGWTPRQLAQQPAKKLQEFLVILGEVDRQAKEELEKIKRQGNFK